jgi:hypothetical protein
VNGERRRQETTFDMDIFIEDGIQKFPFFEKEKGGFTDSIFVLGAPL